MKHDTLQKYDPGNTSKAERALLTTWECLAAYHDDLALVGGLAIRHLTKAPPDEPAGAVTIDVDFGISVGISQGMYGSIRESLGGHGFEWVDNRFVRHFEGMDLHLDLLTDDGKRDAGTVVVDHGLPVSVFPGVERALTKCTFIEISGTTLLGAQRTMRIRVADVGPMLVLKLNAFGGPTGRKQPKDAHDLLYLATNYVGGIREAVFAFWAEQNAGNRGVPGALQSLQNYFGTPDAEGPLACAAFRMNNQHLAPARAEESLRIRQQCVTLANLLTL